jgi:hypothetical protein
MILGFSDCSVESVGEELDSGSITNMKKEARLINGFHPSVKWESRVHGRYGFLGRPRRTRERAGRRRRLNLAWPKAKRERREQASAERASRPPGHTGKKVSSFFSYIYLFSKTYLK